MAPNQNNKKSSIQPQQSFNDFAPPSDITAEKYVLGCLMSEPDSFDRISEIITSECFYNEANRYIFSVISELKVSGKGIDLIAVKDKLHINQSIEKAGGAPYLAHLVYECYSSSSHLEQHSSYLQELCAKREFLKIATDIKERIHSKVDIADVLEIAQNSIDGIFKSFNPIGSNLESLEIHFSDEIQEPDPILTQGEILLMSRGNISFIKGKAKARKSFLSCLFLSSFFGNNSFCLQSGVINGKALLIDTEQAPSHVQKVIKRIYRLCDWNVENRNLKVLPLREFDFKERQIILESAIKTYQPDFVILDGAVDIVGDFNNAEESKIVIGLLMKLSTKYNCHICGVLHEGKGNGELRGHYGAEALNKAETVFDVVKDGELSIVSPNATRNIPFEEFYFKIESGLPVNVGELQKQTPTEINENKIKNSFLSVLSPKKTMAYGKLVKEYMEFTGLADRTTKGHIAKGLQNGWISKENDFFQLIKNSDDELPF